MRQSQHKKGKSRLHEHPSDKSRRNSHSGITVEEISDGEFAYDGDIEVVRPDQYEEPESDPGELEPLNIPHHDYELWQNRLAEKLTALDCNSDTESADAEKRPPSRKRTSRDRVEITFADSSFPNSSAGLEITELQDEPDAGPHAKRPRRKVRRTKTGERIIHVLPNIQPNAGSIRQSTSAEIASSASSANTASSLQTPAEDAMEVD